MKFSHSISGEVLILTLEGDLIGENSGIDLIEVVNTQIAAGARLCIVDIRKLRYINSSGIGVLITILTKFRNKGGDICLLEPSENVKKLLIITKLNAIFQVASDQKEAMKILSEQA
ncbi:MAG: STAS domain-containing protein [Cyclobacteriaceae bacterium]